MSTSHHCWRLPLQALDVAVLALGFQVTLKVVSDWRGFLREHRNINQS